MSWLPVIVGAAIGAPLRHLIDGAVRARADGRFPWGILAVNVLACVLLGALTGAATSGAVPEWVRLLVGPGLCATLSTYSTFSHDTLRLARTGAAAQAVANVVVSVTAGLGGAFLGAATAAAVLGA